MENPVTISITLKFKRIHKGELLFDVENLDYDTIATDQTIEMINYNPEWEIFSRVMPLEHEVRMLGVHPDVSGLYCEYLVQLVKLHAEEKFLKEEASSASGKRYEQLCGPFGEIERITQQRKNIAYVIQIYTLMITGMMMDDIEKMTR